MVFSRLPAAFFAPLASPNRAHYAELLLVYYRLFLEYHSGVERELVIARFASYFASLDAAPARLADDDDASADSGAGTAGPDGAETGPADTRAGDPRLLAASALRRLIACGWVDEEEQLDFSRLVTIRAHARPFFEALDATDRDTAVEYESHIVAVYSSLTGDAAKEHGEHAVLNARYHTGMLVESLKVLEQNIRGHVQSLFERDRTIPEILRSHYDVYMHEVVDRAYTRLKTSDNLSRYRPRIVRAVQGFLGNRAWLDRTTQRLAVIQGLDGETARERVRSMLVEIRDDLASIDPILESIDDRNRRYSRISTERIRAQLHADTTLAGRIGSLVAAISQGTLPPSLELKLHRLRWVSADSLASARTREVGESSLRRPVVDPDEEEIAARELELRVSGQLNPQRVAAFLSARCRKPGDSVWAHDLVDGIDGYIRVLYAASYAERPSGSFPYQVEWGDDRVHSGRFTVPSHRFVRRHDG